MTPKGIIKKFELHLFTDASEKACAGCVYSRITTMGGDVAVYLIAAKTKVTPVKTLSLLRLELSGATIGMKLIQSRKAALKASSLAKPDCFSWSDSIIVLKWLAQLHRKWTTFEANRVSQIQETLPRETSYKGKPCMHCIKGNTCS